MRHRAGILIVMLAAMFVASCAGKSQDSVVRAPNARAQFLKGLRVCIDPGHGGDVGEYFERTQYKRGPTGVREAEVNMRTALALREMLKNAGAETLLTRDADTSVPLDARANLANEWPADIFISIHHNASESPKTNYSSVWYHMDGDDHPASLDLARSLSDGLANELVLTPKSSGIYSDSLIYESGFAVLRHARVPAVLAECSFFTNPQEETRLRDPEYNTRVARSLFDGLCNWAANGIPRWSLKTSEPNRFVVGLSDGMKEGLGSDKLRVRRESVRVLIDGMPAEDWTLNGNVLTVRTPPGGEPPALLDVKFQNRAGNSSVTPPVTIRN